MIEPSIDPEILRVDHFYDCLAGNHGCSRFGIAGCNHSIDRRTQDQIFLLLDQAIAIRTVALQILLRANEIRLGCRKDGYTWLLVVVGNAVTVLAGATINALAILALARRETTEGREEATPGPSRLV